LAGIVADAGGAGWLQVSDDRWAPPVIGEKGGWGNGSGFGLAGPWAVSRSGPEGFPEAFFIFEFISSFLFLISELLCSFFSF
jgi:hypothetical protein